MIWLSVSLFSSTNQWNKLLSDAVVPFISKSNCLEGFTIEFNYLSGENIRLALLTGEENAPELAKLAGEHFTNYFLNAGLPAQVAKLPVSGIFMPFPLNTIQFGLYPPIITQGPNMHDLLATGISQIIIEALTDDIIDDETILTFAFYLRMGLIKTLNPAYPQFVKDLKSKHISLNAVSSNTGEDNNNLLKFEEVKETLIDITRDIFQADRTADLPEWFKQWMAICTENISACCDKLSAEVIYSKILVLISTHLALSAKVDSMLTCFIEQILLYEEL